MGLSGAWMHPAPTSMLGKPWPTPNFPRHLATHVGGFVMSRGPLTEMAVVGNAAMAGRTVLECQATG